VNKIFIDTGAFIALNDKADQYHYPAAQFFQKLLNKNYLLFTSNLVIAETYTRILYHSKLQTAIDFLTIISQGGISIFYSDKSTETSCITYLKKYKDIKLSYTDAVSFQLMKDNTINDVFAFDWHFKAAGFNVFPNNTI